MADDRPRISGYIPAAGAPLTTRTLALRPGESLEPGPPPTWADEIANAVYGWLGRHGPSDLPEQGRENLASFAGGASKILPPVSANEALASARAGDFPGTVTNILGALPIVPGAKAAAIGETVGKGVAETLAERAAATAPAEAAPIIAYHGSPYTFDRFDISKIGTGEGAQAFGHGLYFAGNEDVAKTYRPKGLTYEGQPAGQSWATRALFYIDPKIYQEQGAQAALDEAKTRLADSAKFYSSAYGGSGPNLYDNAIEQLKTLDPAKIGQEGSMYQVGINAKPEDFLDWDAPISQQPQAVKDLVAQKLGEHSFLAETGSDAVRYLGGGRDPTAAGSQLLAGQGLKGIRYLDQGSRDVGEGTSNYVVFDPAIVDILKRYGLIGLGTAGGAAALTGGQPAQPAEAATPDQPPAPIGTSPQYDDWWRRLQNQQFAAGVVPQ